MQLMWYNVYIKKLMGANMSNNSSQMLVIENEISFTQDEIKLKKLLKALDKASVEAVEVLLKCMHSQDEKIRLTAATKLLDFHIDVTEKINADKIQRMVAEIKLVKSTNGSLVPIDESKRPVVDFTTVRTLD